MVTLDKANHTITADETKDNFSASLTPMFDAMTTEQLNEWNQYINAADFKVYQVGTNDDGSDKDITNGVSQGGVTLKFKDADGNALTDLDWTNGQDGTEAKKARKIIVDLNHNWPADFALDKEYYILATYKDEADDVISQAKIPFKLSIPALSSLFERQDGIWVNDVANAYMYETANRGEDADKKNATYTIKNAFKQLATTVGTSTFDVELDNADANKISGKKHNELATLANETGVTGTNVNNLTITLKDGLVSGGNNADGTQLGYKKELILHVKNVKFVNKYSYGDETYDFKVKVMSPLFEGKVYAVGNAVELSATSLEGQKINDSNIKAHTYNVSEVYSIFSDKAATDYWKRNEIKSVVFESGNDELFSVTRTGTTYVAAAGDNPAVPGYATVTVNNSANISVDTNSTIKVTVTDAWGYKLVQEIPVVLKVNQGNN